MLGAIAGDYIGSRHEFNPIKITEFELCHADCRITDDTIMTAAIADAFLKTEGMPVADDFRRSMVEFGNRHIDAGYGFHFLEWLLKGGPEPYGSAGNGSCMRVSSVAWFAADAADTARLAALSAAPSHSHPDGIRGATAVAVATRMALEGWHPDIIRNVINNRYGYMLNVTADDIRPNYKFKVLAKNSAPPAIVCALEALSWEQGIRLCISLGGDADTMAAMAGGILEAAAYAGTLPGIPSEVQERVISVLPPDIAAVFQSFRTEISGRTYPRSDLTLLPALHYDSDFDAS